MVIDQRDKILKREQEKAKQRKERKRKDIGKLKLKCNRA
jgi:hypothetical protein